MDEPLAGVDAARKGEILALIARVQTRFGLTIVHVSHDLDEVAALADHLVLLEAGRTLRHAPADALFADPSSPLAKRADARVRIEGRVFGQEGGLTIVQAGEARLVAPRHEGQAGDPIRLQVFARDVALARATPQSISTRNILPAEIVSLHPRGDGQALVALKSAAGPLLSLITEDAVRELELGPGLTLFALVKAIAVK
jgi:molybdate transport system ATP-binding protein